MKTITILQRKNTPIGTIYVAASKIGLVRVDLCDSQTMTQSDQYASQPDIPHDIAFKALEEISDYLTKKRTRFTIPLDWSDQTPFQKRVLEIALMIPFGEVMTYGEIAHQLGNKNASRAVGAALGQNPMPLVIPCHRVVAANGSLTGFSAADGIRTKQWLLELEGHQVVAQKLV